MSLPAPQYTTTGLDHYFAATGMYVPTPPGSPKTWTTMLHLLGPGVLLARGDRDNELFDRDLVAEALKETGRPIRKDERRQLLWVTPLPGSTTAKSLLLPLLDSGRYWARQRGAIAIGKAFAGQGAAAGVTKALLKTLGDDDNDARRGAAQGLGLLGDIDAAPALAKRESDSDDSVDAAILEALIRLNALGKVESILAEKDESEFGELALAMCAMERGEDATSTVSRFLDSSDGDQRRVAARYLAARPAWAAKMVEPLLEALDRGDNYGAIDAVSEALAAAGEEALEPVIEKLDAGDWRVRMNACAALAFMGPVAKDAAPALRGKLEDSDNDVQREAAFALACVGDVKAADAKLSTRGATFNYGFLFRAAKTSANHPVIAWTRMVLGRQAPDASLVRCFTQKTDDNVRAMAAILAGLIDPDTFNPLLEAYARDDAREVNLEVRRACAAAQFTNAYVPTWLGATHRVLLCGEGSTSSSPGGPVDNLDASELMNLATRDGDWPVRFDAFKLLQRMGDDAAQPYMAQIEYQARHDPDADVRMLAGDICGMGWASDRVGDLLVGLLQPPRGNSSDEKKAASLRNLVARAPALGVPFAQQMAVGDDRDLARAASKIVGGAVTTANAHAVIAGALTRLQADSWVAREAACDLLGALPVDQVDEGLMEEVAEVLRDKHSDDSDSDVQNAAKAALEALGQPVEV